MDDTPTIQRLLLCPKRAVSEAGQRQDTISAATVARRMIYRNLVGQGLSWPEGVFVRYTTEYPSRDGVEYEAQLRAARLDRALKRISEYRVVFDIGPWHISRSDGVAVLIRSKALLDDIAALDRHELRQIEIATYDGKGASWSFRETSHDMLLTVRTLSERARMVDESALPQPGLHCRTCKLTACAFWANRELFV